MRLADRSLAVKCVIATACMALVALVVGGVSVSRMSALRDDLRSLTNGQMDRLEKVSDMRGELAAMYRGLVIHAAAAGDATIAGQGQAAVTAADQRLDAALAAYRAGAAPTTGRQAALTTLDESLRHFRALRDTVVLGKPITGGYTVPAADQILPEFTRVEDAMNGSVAALQTEENAESDALAARGARQYRTALLITLVALAAGILLAAAVGAVVMRLIRAQLATVSAALGAVAGGNLTVAAEVRGRDELGDWRWRSTRPGRACGARSVPSPPARRPSAPAPSI